MSNFAPNREHSRIGLLFLFHLKKTAAESHRMLVDALGEHSLSKSTCQEWVQRFKNNDFELNKVRPGQSKKFEDTELQALLKVPAKLKKKLRKYSR